MNTKFHPLRRTLLQNTKWAAVILLISTTGCNTDQSRFVALEQQLQGISQKLDLLDDHVTLGDSGNASDPEASNPIVAKVSREFLKADAEGKQVIIDRQIQQAKAFEAVSLDNIEEVLNCLESLTAIMEQSGLSAESITSLDQTQQDLIDLLQTKITSQIRSMHQQALDSDDFGKARSVWIEASTLLEYFPSTNDPRAENQYKMIADDHEDVASKIQQKQEQKYNRWACSQIKKAGELTPGQSPEACVNICKQYIGPIDPGLLDPLSLEIYSSFIQTVKTQIPLAAYYDMAEQVSVIRRKSLAEITDVTPSEKR